MLRERKQDFPDTIKRFDESQRIQHLILLGSMLMLIFTGFPIKYAQSEGAKFVVSLFGNFDNMLIVHLTSGVLMLFSGVLHIVWLVKIFRQNGPQWSMIPTLRDVTDAYHHALYLLGIHKEHPPYSRYTYLEKFEYLAVIYGILLMGGTGIILWFPNISALIMPRWVIEMVRIAHSNEALLATFAVVIGHFFWVHFNPDVFPTSSVWINGKISKHHLKEEHLLEYEQLAETYEKVDHRNEEAPSRFAHSLPLILIELCIYISLFVFLLYVFIPKLFA